LWQLDHGASKYNKASFQDARRTLFDDKREYLHILKITFASKLGVVLFYLVAALAVCNIL